MVAGAKGMEDLGCEYVIHHIGYDERRGIAARGQRMPSPLDQLREVVAAVNVPVQAVGGLSIEQAVRTPEYGAPLVVLGACGTIRGEADHVEGMPSLARAFLAAGARSVVGTLWEIDDDTASRLFRRMHQQIRAGQSPAAALRAAQTALVHDPDARLRHPSTWAPVEILGKAD